MARSRASPDKKGRRYRMAEEILTGEAAEFLGVTKDFIIKLAKRGKIKGEKKGRDWWIDKKSLEDYDKTRRPDGRPLGTLSSEPPRNRAGTGGAAEREREY